MIGRKFSSATMNVFMECILGIVLVWLFGDLLILILPVPKVSALTGWLVGCALSILSMWHISYVTETTMAMRNSKAATRFTITRYIGRKVITFVVVVASYYLPYLNMITLVIGLFSLKAGAYLQPLVHRILERRTLWR